jgi:hypothetical protein
MKRKTLLALSAVPLTLLLSSCFVLQGFWLTSSSIDPGQTTKAVFKLHAYSTTKDKGYQFVVVGVPTGGDLKVQGTKWGTNGTAGGPYAMAGSTGLATEMGASGDCSSNGFDFSSVTGVDWKGFMTPNQVADKGKVNTEVLVQTTIKAAPAAQTDVDYQVLGVTGKWLDDGDGIVEAADDSFFCTGFGLVNIYVNA